jgi:hypothetical protein
MNILVCFNLGLNSFQGKGISVLGVYISKDLKIYPPEAD